MISIDAKGLTCPIPVIKTKEAIQALTENEEVEVLVDNEIAVQNLTKMANQMGFKNNSEKLSDNEFKVSISVEASKINTAGDEEVVCAPARVDNTVVVISQNTMGNGNDELGKVLIKGFIYAIANQDKLPKTMLFYNGGAQITCEDSESLEDLKTLEAQGVEILTCGTCLNFYNLADKLAVGQVTNMYVIAEKMSNASLIIKP